MVFFENGAQGVERIYEGHRELRAERELYTEHLALLWWVLLNELIETLLNPAHVLPLVGRCRRVIHTDSFPSVPVVKLVPFH